MNEVIKSLPVIALKGMTILPYMVIHFDISRKNHINTVEYAMLHGQRLFITAKEQNDEDEEEDDRDSYDEDDDDSYYDDDYDDDKAGNKLEKIITIGGFAIAAIIICMLILGWLISKLKIAQALKLGED